MRPDVPSKTLERLLHDFGVLGSNPVTAFLESQFIVFCVYLNGGAAKADTSKLAGCISKERLCGNSDYCSCCCSFVYKKNEFEMCH